MNKTLRSATAAVLMLTTSTWSVVAAAAPVAPEAALSDEAALASATQEREQVAAWDPEAIVTLDPAFARAAARVLYPIGVLSSSTPELSGGADAEVLVFDLAP